MKLHEYYNRLGALERRVVDATLADAFGHASDEGIVLHGGDPCERAADALARWVIESRTP